MVVKWIEVIIGLFEEKKQYKQVQVCINVFFELYCEMVKVQQCYNMYYGGVIDGDIIVKMFFDIVDIWECVVFDGILVSVIVGDDLVEFVENYVVVYGGCQWIDKECVCFIKVFDDVKKKEEL